MAANDKKKLVKQAKALMEDEGLADALSQMIEEQRGQLGFLLSTMTYSPRQACGVS